MVPSAGISYGLEIVLSAVTGRFVTGALRLCLVDIWMTALLGNPDRATVDEKVSSRPLLVIVHCPGHADGFAFRIQNPSN